MEDDDIEAQREKALRQAHEIVARDGKTAAVFVKLDKYGDEVEFVAGSAYLPSPKGFRLDTIVSVTGLERSVRE